MEYAIEELKRSVRVALDENNTSATLSSLGDVDTLSVEEIIESKLEDAALIVHRDAPRHLLDVGLPFSGTIRWESAVGYGRGVMTLPADFLRLVTFRMSDWRKDVTEPIYEDDPRYTLQLSAFSGVLGCPEKPVVALIQASEGLTLELYSCEAGESIQVEKARYLPRPKIREGKLTICERLREAVVYYAGALTALTLGNSEQAKALMETSKTLME